MVEPPVSRPMLLAHIDYSTWATSRLLDAVGRLTAAELLQDLRASHSSILGTLQHIYYADRAWLGRLHQSPPPSFMDPAPGPELADLKDRWPQVLAGLRAFIESAPEERFTERLAFKRLNGDPQQMEHWKVLLHVVNHATLHRGQVMAMLRQLGHVPPSTDYLFYQLQQQGTL